MESNFLSKRQAAERLGVTPRTVENWIKSGKFPNARQIGKQWAIPEDEVHTAVMYLDVIPVKRELSQEDLVNAFSLALERERSKLTEEIKNENEKLANELKSENKELHQNIKELEKKLENFHDEVVTRWLREKQEQKKPLIKRLLGWK